MTALGYTREAQVLGAFPVLGTGWVTPRQLCRRTGLSPHEMRGALVVLRNAGLVHRQRHWQWITNPVRYQVLGWEWELTP